MRTHIMIDDELMADVLKLTGIKSKREAVEQALRTLLALKQQEKIMGCISARRPLLLEK